MASWTTPKTWVSSAVLAASELNTVRDNLIWLKAALAAINQTSDATPGALKTALYGASAYRSTGQQLTTGSNTTIQLPSEYKDTNDFHSTVTNTARLTIPPGGDGDYEVGYTLEFAANATGDRYAALAVDGSVQDWGKALISAASGSNTTVVNGSALWVGATAGQYITLVGRQGSGGNLNVSYANLWIMRVSSSA